MRPLLPGERAAARSQERATASSRPPTISYLLFDPRLGRGRLISRLLQGINQIVAGALIVELLSEVGIHLEVDTPLLNLLNYLGAGTAIQEQRDVVFRQGPVRGSRDKA